MSRCQNGRTAVISAMELDSCRTLRPVMSAKAKSSRLPAHTLGWVWLRGTASQQDKWLWWGDLWLCIHNSTLQSLLLNNRQGRNAPHFRLHALASWEQFTPVLLPFLQEEILFYSALILRSLDSLEAAKHVHWKTNPIFLTLSLSLIDPFPRMDIFTPVSSCNLFMEFPLGPSSFPTKLNCKHRRKKKNQASDHCFWLMPLRKEKKWRWIRGQVRLKVSLLPAHWKKNLTRFDMLAGHLSSIIKGSRVPLPIRHRRKKV